MLKLTLIPDTINLSPAPGHMKTSFWLIIFFLAAVKIALMQAIPLSAIAYNIHDDTLFIVQAGGFGLWLSDLLGQSSAVADLNFNLPKGGWLGQYNEFILCKGPVYGIWIAFCLLAGIPLLTAQQLLYIIAGIMIIMGLKKELPSQPLLLILFTFFLFNPEFISRVLRAGIYPALSILIIAGLFGLYSNRHSHWKQFGIWALLLGCILPFFWMTREEGIWLIPSILTVSGATLISVYSQQGLCRHLFIKAFLLCIPFLFLLGGIQAVSSLNSHFYGTKCVVELKSDSFRSAYGALLRVKHTPSPHIVVPSSVRKKIYPVSPAFQELEPFLEGERREMWQQFGCQVYPETCGEIATGWFLWAFREAVALSGHHTTGQDADNYYMQLAKEINTACNEKQLSCLPERKSLMPPLTVNDYIKIIRNIPKGLAYLLRFETLLERLNEPFHSLGESEMIIHYQDMTREQVAPNIDENNQIAPPLPIQGMLNKIKLKILRKFAVFYQTSTLFLFSLASLLYFLSLGYCFWKKRLRPLTLFTTTLLLAISSRLFILSLIDVTSFPGYHYFYLAPLYSFVLLFIGLSYIDFSQIIMSKK